MNNIRNESWQNDKEKVIENPELVIVSYLSSNGAFLDKTNL